MPAVEAVVRLFEDAVAVCSQEKTSSRYVLHACRSRVAPLLSMAHLQAAAGAAEQYICELLAASP